MQAVPEAPRRWNRAKECQARALHRARTDLGHHHRVWASLDPRRPTKTTGFLIDCGRSVASLITPDDPDAAEATLREHLAPGVLSDDPRDAIG